MGLDEIKRWQWALIGILVGLGLGYMWTSQDAASGDAPMISQPEFEREIALKDQKSGQMYIKDVVLQPITKDFRNRDVQPVTFKRLRRGAKSGNLTYAPAQYIAQLPYQPMMNGPRPIPANLTLVDYLANVAKTRPDVKFGYGWYNERPAALCIFTLGSVALIGGVWPTLLQLMVGAGFAPKVKEKKSKKEKAKEEDYFARFSHAPDADHSKPAKVVSAADQQRLEDMNKILEREVDGIVADSTVSIPQSTAPGEVRKLQGSPLEASVIPKSPEDDDEIEVKGEFYPVLIHHKKHHDEHQDEESEKKS